ESRPGAAARATPARPRRLLVRSGGADPGGMTRRTLDALAALAAATRAGLLVRAIVGAATRAGAAIEEGGGGGARGFGAEILRDVRDMPAQMAWADLAVTSGGSTVWELAR